MVSISGIASIMLSKRLELVLVLPRHVNKLKLINK